MKALFSFCAINMWIDVELGDTRSVAEALSRKQQGRCLLNFHWSFIWIQNIAHFPDLAISLLSDIEYIAAEMSDDKSNNNLERELSNRICRSTEIEDLQGPQDPAMAPLSIKVCL